MSPLEELNEAYGEVFEMLTVHGCHDSVIPLKPFAAYTMSLIIREMGLVEVAG